MGQLQNEEQVKLVLLIFTLVISDETLTSLTDFFKNIFHQKFGLSVNLEK